MSPSNPIPTSPHTPPASPKSTLALALAVLGTSSTPVQLSEVQRHNSPLQPFRSESTSPPGQDSHPIPPSSRSSSISQASIASTPSDASEASVFSNASTSSSRSTHPPETFYAGLPAQGVQRTAHLFATGQVYGTYHLANGRRGAISGPSSTYYEGRYERGNVEGRSGRGRNRRSDGDGNGTEIGDEHDHREKSADNVVHSKSGAEDESSERKED